jgi:hypothetical protein
VAANLAAYGAKDPEAMGATLAEDVVLRSGGGAFEALGKDAVVDTYAATWTAYPLSGTTQIARISFGDVVIDHERSERADGKKVREVVTIYRIGPEGITLIEVADDDGATALTADLVARQLAAYNAQDLDGHCACFAPDVVVSNLGEAANLEGIEAYHARYQGVFAQFPQNRAEVLARIVLGSFAVDHERVWRSPETAPFEVLAIYTVTGESISHVRFVR